MNTIAAWKNERKARRPAIVYALYNQSSQKLANDGDKFKTDRYFC